ncbi:MAG: hypothetical protein ACOX7H_00720 [Bacillota bacterium]
MQDLQQLFEKMQDYTKMTEELPFPEFSQYYQEVMTCLQKDYQEFDQEDLIKAKGICSIIFINAQARAMKKDDNRKKFLKIAEKSNFWQDAIKSRLMKEGLSAQEISDKEEALWQDDASAETSEEAGQ